MKITETEMRGLITGKAMPADIFVGESLAAYLIRKFTSLYTERDALAAENVALKSAFHPENLPEEAVDAVNSTAQFDWDSNDCGSWTWVVNDDDVAKAVICAITPPQTPATDAYLNSVRAEGVEMFASAVQGGCAVGDRVKDLADMFAAQLRAGKDGE
ncbi:hypothetical protein ABEG72_16135 [Pantoea agglomerans]|uniref:hypothetical protein n=1 Tax=Enterobacter agglomerans TaxID=549 RepID=UPI00320ACF7C